MKLLTLRAPNLVTYGLTWGDALDLDVPDALDMYDEQVDAIDKLSTK